jgi:hypothetical protein
MNEDILHRLVDVKILISAKQVFTPNEAKIIFDLYNDITGANDQVTSCSACVNKVITRLKKEIRANGL